MAHVKFNGATILGLGPSHRLMPGETVEIPDEVLAEFEGSPVVRGMIESGDLEITDAPKRTRKSKAAKATEGDASSAESTDPEADLKAALGAAK